MWLFQNGRSGGGERREFWAGPRLQQAGKGETSVSNSAEQETQRLKFSSLGNGVG